jgi:dihydrofolate reductase
MENAMRKLILTMSLSADGFVAGINGEAGWIGAGLDEDVQHWLADGLTGAGVHLVGSDSLQEISARWSEGPCALGFRAAPLLVLTRGDFVPTPATVSLPGPLEQTVARLKREPGSDLVAHGGASVAQALIRAGLVDEFRLLVHPLALGSGLPLFPILDEPMQLSLTQLRHFRNGVVGQVLRPA